MKEPGTAVRERLNPQELTVSPGLREALISRAARRATGRGSPYRGRRVALLKAT
jgi:hypothetical protein